MIKILRLVVVITLPLFVVSCKSTTPLTQAPGSTQQEAGSSSESAESLDALESLYNERLKNARMRFTEADVHFMTGMIAHHAQALVMSELAPKNDAGPEIQTLAARIINAQKDEIATMQRWLKDRGQKVPEVHIDGTHLMVHGAGEHHMHMPGMLSL